MSWVDQNVGQAFLTGVWGAGGDKGTQRNVTIMVYTCTAHNHIRMEAVAPHHDRHCVLNRTEGSNGHGWLRLWTQHRCPVGKIMAGNWTIAIYHNMMFS